MSNQLTIYSKHFRCLTVISGSALLQLRYVIPDHKVPAKYTFKVVKLHLRSLV